MKIQEKKWSCGAAAVVNALRCLGKTVDERAARKLVRADSDGTSEFGIMLGLDSLGYEGEIEHCHRRQEAQVMLELAAFSPALLAVDDNTHWAVVAGKLGERYIYIDSDRSRRNRRENGIYFLTADELLKKWKKPCGEYYMILVSKK